MTKTVVTVNLLVILLLSVFWVQATEEMPLEIRLPSERTAMEIDHQAFKDQLIQGNLAYTVEVSPTANGYFKTALNRQWQPTDPQKSHLVSQTRLLYVMAQGYDLTLDPVYLEALRNGADFLLKHYRAAGKGKWYWQVSPEGKVLVKSKPAYDAYGQAFVIFGLAHAYRVTADERYLTAALATWEHLDVWDVIGAARAPVDGYSQNPLMHTFEALLTLHEATGIEAVLADAQRVVDFVLDRLYQEQDAYIPEKFTRTWRPLSVAKGGYVDIGHQFEWAYFLSWAVQQGLPDHYVTIGHQLIDAALATGYDADKGGILAQYLYQGEAVGHKGSWQQCELLRALMHYASLRDRDDLWALFQQSLNFVQDQFIDPVYGGWYPRPADTTTLSELKPSKGTPWKVGYHVTGMYKEGLDLTLPMPTAK